MSRTLSPSSLTLAGLVKHMALVEDHYFTHQLMDSPEELQELWLAAVRRSEAATDHILTSTGLDTPVVESDGNPPHTLSRILIEMVEEYARHTGHADLIRESGDGLVGEDAP